MNTYRQHSSSQRDVRPALYNRVGATSGPLELMRSWSSSHVFKRGLSGNTKSPASSRFEAAQEFFGVWLKGFYLFAGDLMMMLAGPTR
eukprot:2325986-Rhodomonas_salina.2